MKYLEKICCFFIFARIFIHMCPNEKYEKYLSALIEWIAFCLFLIPFLSGEAFSQNRESWENRWQQQMDFSFEETLEEMEENGKEAAMQIAEEAVTEAQEEEAKERKNEETGINREKEGVKKEDELD